MDSTRVDLLLIEDSVDDRAFVCHFMQELGELRVRVARNGAEALEIMFGSCLTARDAPARLQPRLLILDLNMPQIGGLEMIGRFKLNPHTRSIPLVVLSSSDDARDAARCYQAGANSYIVKPTEFVNFGRTVTLLGQYWFRLNLAPEPAPPPA